MSEAEALKPCPFCPDSAPTVRMTNSHQSRYCVECVECYGAGPVKDGKAEAIAAWNARESIPIAKVREVVEKLEELSKDKGEDDVQNEYHEAMYLGSSSAYASAARLVRRELLGGE